MDSNNIKERNWVICLDSDFRVSTWGQVTSTSNPDGATVRYYGPIWDSNYWSVKYLLLQSSREVAKNFYEKNYGEYYPKVQSWNSVQARINANEERKKKGLPLFG